MKVAKNKLHWVGYALFHQRYDMLKRINKWRAIVACFIFPVILAVFAPASAFDSSLPESVINDSIYALIKKGEQSIRLHDLEEAVRCYDQALEIADVYHHAEGRFYAAISMAIGYTEFGRYEDAKAWYRKALFYYPQTNANNRHIHGARTLNNIGNLYFYQGHFNEATGYYFKAADLVQGQAAHEVQAADYLIRIYNNIANALLHLYEYDRALYYLDKAETLGLASDLPRQLASVLNYKAMLWCRKQQPDTAWFYVQRALKLAKQTSPSLVEYTGYQTIAEILISKGQPEQAIPYLHRALQYEHYVNPYYRTGVLYTLGYSYLLVNNYPSAAQYLKAASESAWEANSVVYLLRSHQKLADLYTETGQCNKALEHKEAAYQLNDSLLNKQKTEAVNLLEVKYRTAEKDKELINKQLLISIQENNLKQKNIWIYSVSGAAVLLVLLGVNYYRSIRHNQKLQLLRAVIVGEEKERERIGQELHDGIGGRLAAINLHFGAVQKRYEDLVVAGELESIMAMLDATAMEIRNTAHNLIPDILSKRSFSEAIRLYCEQVSSPKLQLQIEIDEHLPELPGKDMELMLYRIIQELVQNIVKHSNATVATVTVAWNKKELIIIAEDNGIGFNPTAPTEGIGLQNVASRVKTLKGEISIDSQPNRGTSVSIAFDLIRLKKILSDEN